MGYVELNVLNKPAPTGPAGRPRHRPRHDELARRDLARRAADGAAPRRPERRSCPRSSTSPRAGRRSSGAKRRDTRSRIRAHALRGQALHGPRPGRRRRRTLAIAALRGRPRPSAARESSCDGRSVSRPEELSALILREGRTRPPARRWASTRRRSAVITVPAYFDDAQRQATRDAARIAGLDVLRIVNEPTAASLAYGLDQRDEGQRRRVRPGRRDVRRLDPLDRGRRVPVLATNGDTHLGGDDFDQRLSTWRAEDLGAQHGERPDPRPDVPAGRAPRGGALQGRARRTSPRPISHLMVPHERMRLAARASRATSSRR